MERSLRIPLLLLCLAALILASSSANERGDEGGYWSAIDASAAYRKSGIIFPGSSPGLGWSFVDSLNCKWVRWQLPWQTIEPSPGVFSWSYFDARVDQAREAGCFLIPVVKSQSSWATDYDPQNDPPSLSRPPNDLGEWNSEYGYSQTYYRFIKAFVERYGRKVPGLVIENEINGRNNMWSDGTNDEEQRLVKYMKLLATAHKAANDARSFIVVADSGFRSASVGEAIARDILDGNFSVDGVTGPAKALEFYNGYFRNFPDQTIRHFDTPGNLSDFLYGAGKQREYIFVTEFYKRIGNPEYIPGNLDAVNIHFYEDGWLLEPVIQWVTYRFGLEGRSLRMIICNEGGVRRRNPNYDKRGRPLAADMIKQLMYTFESRLGFYTWFPRDGGPRMQVGFLNGDGSPRLAAITLEFLNTQFANRQYNAADSQPIFDRPDIQRYRVFNTTVSLPTMQVLWWDDGGHGSGSASVTIDIPEGALRVRTYDLDGSIVTDDAIPAGRETLDLVVTEEPAMLEFLP